MLKNLTTGRLVIILVILIGIYAAFEFLGGPSRSQSFRDTLVDIDTGKVEKIIIEGGTENTEIFKTDGKWKVKLKEGKNAEASEGSVDRTINTLLQIEPSRLVAKDKSKWNTYQVDTAGTRVQVYEEGNKKTLDIIIGKFGMQNRRQFHTYVRLNDEEDVYAADNFMGASFNTNPSDFRNKQISRITPDSLNSIAFNYPADSSFSLSRADSVWVTDENILADSAKAAKYTSQFRSLNNSEFVDDIEPDGLGSPTLQLVLKSNNKNDVTINAWQLPQHGWVINSSTNPESYFSDSALYDKLFIGKSHFLNEPN